MHPRLLAGAAPRLGAAGVTCLCINVSQGRDSPGRLTKSLWPTSGKIWWTRTRTCHPGTQTGLKGNHHGLSQALQIPRYFCSLVSGSHSFPRKNAPPCRAATGLTEPPPPPHISQALSLVPPRNPRCSGWWRTWLVMQPLFRLWAMVPVGRGSTASAHEWGQGSVRDGAPDPEEAAVTFLIRLGPV